MSAFLYGIFVGWKMDIRNKGILLTYYVVPLLFFVFMGGIFTSIMPETESTITQTMVVFCITMGAYLGTPSPLVALFSSDVKKTYLVSKIPLWTIAINNFISAFIHLLIVSIIITLISPLVFAAILPDNLFVYIIGLILTLIASISIGSVLGFLVKKITKLTIVGQILFLPSLMLSGIMFPSNMLPEFLQNIGKIFPATWGFEFMRSESVSFEMLLPAIITIVLSLVICIWKLNRLKAD